MKRLRLILLSLLVAVCAVAIVRYLWEQHIQKQQEAAFQSRLQSYAATIHLGTTRRDREPYFHLKAIPFHRQAIEEKTTDANLTAYADLTKIGEGDHPWYCKR